MIQILADTMFSAAQALHASGIIDLATLQEVARISCSILC